jgi:hypothetical protein
VRSREKDSVAARSYVVWIVALLISCSGTPPTVDPGPRTCPITIAQVPLETRVHIPEDQTPVYLHNPPVSGEHYFVWARWGVHTEMVPRGYWVHNLEHGGVIFLYRPDAQQSVVDALTDVSNSIPNDPPCSHGRVVMTSDPMLDVPWAVTVSGPEGEAPLGVGYQIKSDCIAAKQTLIDFAVQHRNQSAETICEEGFYPP